MFGRSPAYTYIARPFSFRRDNKKNKHTYLPPYYPASLPLGASLSAILPTLLLSTWSILIWLRLIRVFRRMYRRLIMPPRTQAQIFQKLIRARRVESRPSAGVFPSRKGGLCRGK